jgi:hypothetical protein
VDTRESTVRNTVVFAAVVEFATALALLIDPALVARLLLGMELGEAGAIFGRFFGVALIALGLAWWSGASSGSAPRGMLAYNVLIAVYIAYLGAGQHHGGLLLWAAVALHCAVALILVLTRNRQA